MAFGQQSGPPATARQIQRITELVQQIGHDGLRDARHPLGLTQRQSNGKFTRAEADELIERLESGALSGGHGGIDAPQAPTRRETEQVRVLQKLPDETLAAELQRRGWVVMEP